MELAHCIVSKREDLMDKTEMRIRLETLLFVNIEVALGTHKQGILH